MLVASNWEQYKILDTGDGEKLENWNGKILLRPDPQIIWPSENVLSETKELHARYIRASSGGGSWEKVDPKFDPDIEWNISYKDLTFRLKLMGFKHTGLFPEQAANWDKMRELLDLRPLKVLNLFAYTGGASVALAKDGAFVTHVDAAKGMIERAKINAELSGVGGDRIRYIVDDCRKFLEREIRRGNLYDAVILDPPSYGRSPAGELWKLEANLYSLLELVNRVLSPKFAFVLLNGYTTGLGATTMQNMLNLALKNRSGASESFELILPTLNPKIHLPCGNSAYFYGS